MSDFEEAISEKGAAGSLYQTPVKLACLRVIMSAPLVFSYEQGLAPETPQVKPSLANQH